MASHSKTWNPISPSMQLSLSDRYSSITTHQNGLDRLEIISEDSGGSALLFRELLPKSLCIRDLHRISVTDSGYKSGRSTDTPPWENPGPRYISKQSSGYLNRTMWQCQVLWVRGQRLNYFSCHMENAKDNLHHPPHTAFCRNSFLVHPRPC